MGFINLVYQLKIMRCAVLFSGGKDSTRAVYRARKQEHEVAALLTIFSKNKDSYMFHTCNIHFSKLQAEAIGLPQLTAESEGKKEEELSDLKNLIADAKKKFNIKGVVCGGLSSKYQASRIEKICAELGLKMIAPLWGINPKEHLLGLLSEGFKVIFISVSADGLGEKWLGRELDSKAAEELLEIQKKTGISPVGEGGEYESLVLDCPLYKKRILLEVKEKMWDEKTSSGFLVADAKLVKK